MIVYSFNVKGQRGNYIMNVDYNKTLKTYHLVTAGKIENGKLKNHPVPLPLFNRVYDNKSSAVLAAQQWVSGMDITEGRR